MPTWAVPVAGRRTLLRDVFFPRGCLTSSGHLAFIANTNEGFAKAWRDDGSAITLGPTRGNHARGIRPGSVPGSVEVTWLDVDPSVRCLATWFADGTLGPIARVPIALPEEQMPPADGFVGWNGDEPNWTHVELVDGVWVPATLRRVRGRLIGRPFTAGPFVVGDDCEAPADVDRVVIHDGAEWFAVRGAKGQPWQTHSIQTQVDETGLVGLYGDGDDLFVPQAEWRTRPLRLVDLPVDTPAPLPRKPTKPLAIGCFSFQGAPAPTRLVIPIGAAERYLDDPSRRLVQVFTPVPDDRCHGLLALEDPAGDTAEHAIANARQQSVERAIGLTVYQDSSPVRASVLALLKDGDTISWNCTLRSGQSLAAFVDAIEAEATRLQALGYRAMPSISVQNFTENDVRRLLDLVTPVLEAHCFGCYFFAAGRANVAQAVLDTIDAWTHNVVLPDRPRMQAVSPVRTKDPAAPKPSYREDTEFYRWMRKDVGPVLAALTKITNAADLAEQAGHCWRGILKRDPTIGELEWAVQKYVRDHATDDEIRAFLRLKSD